MSLLLRPKDRQAILNLVHHYIPGVTAWAYGSRVTGQAHDTSDLDLVLRAPNLSKIPIGALETLNDALRQSNIPILVEVRDWARLPDSFQKEILKQHVDLENLSFG